jgi:hypothetical protein
MKRLPVKWHLAADQACVQYRACRHAVEKTRWHAIWLLLRGDPPRSPAEVAEVVGLSAITVREAFHRWNAHGPGPPGRVPPPGQAAPDRRQFPFHLVELVDGQTDLPQVVPAPGAVGRLAHHLHGRQHQAHQHRDDRDDDHGFNQGQPGPLMWRITNATIN